MNIFTFLTEGRGFTYQNKLYSAGGNKLEKKYFCDKEEISKEEYEKALAAHRAEKTSPSKEKKPLIKQQVKKSLKEKKPVAKQKVKQNTNLPKRVAEIAEYIEANAFVPSEKTGEEGRKENIERINKMLRLPFGTNFGGLRDEAVLYTCNALSRMAKDFPFILDHAHDDSLNFFSTKKGLIDILDDLRKNPEHTKDTPFYDKSLELYEKDVEEDMEFLENIDDANNIKDEDEKLQFESKFFYVGQKFFGKLPCKLPRTKFKGATNYITALCAMNYKNRSTYVKSLNKTLKSVGFDIDLESAEFEHTLDYGDCEDILKAIFKKMVEGKNKDVLKKTMLSEKFKESAVVQRVTNTFSSLVDEHHLRSSHYSGVCYTFFNNGSKKSVILNDKINGSSDKYEFWYAGSTYGLFKPEDYERSGLSDVTIHELAHVVDARKDFWNRGTIYLQTPIKIGGKTFSSIPSVQTFMDNVYKAVGKKQIEENITHYATTDAAEMVAEAFAQVYCKEKPSELAKEIVEAMKILVKETMKYEAEIEKLREKKS